MMPRSKLLIVAGTTLITVGVILPLSVLDDAPRTRTPTPEISWSLLKEKPVFGVMIAMIGASIVNRGRRLRLLETAGPELQMAVASDAPLAVYLRPFNDERSSAHPGAWLSTLYAFSVETEEEQMVVAANVRFGQCVAVARPGDRVPLLGARRISVSDAEWQSVVTKWLGQATIALVRVGDTPGIVAELTMVTAMLRPQQIVLLIPNVLVRGGLRARRATRDFIRGYSGCDLRSLPIVWPVGRSLAAIIYFDANRQPHVWKLVRPFANSSVTRPYVPMFSAAFAQVDINLQAASKAVALPQHS